MVYVVDRHGKPLMPTKKYGRVKHLLEEGLAVPICNKPFTIKLKYESRRYTQNLYLGIDPGRENIGVAVSLENGSCIFKSELETKNKTIKKNMEERKQFRRARRQHLRQKKQRRALRDGNAFKTGDKNTLRGKKQCLSKSYRYHKMPNGVITCKVIKGAEAQFSNRKKHSEFTPSARQSLQLHIREVEGILKFLPITHVVLERNTFDFQKLENQNIANWEYSKGPLYGYTSYKDFIHDQQKGKCLLCNKGIEEYHHIRPLSQGGSDTISNIAGLCWDCHNGNHGVHKDMVTAQRLNNIKQGISQKYSVSLLNTIMPKLIEDMSNLCLSHGLTFCLTDGYRTYYLRKAMNLEKRHSTDAYLISTEGRHKLKCQPNSRIYYQRRFKKKSANNIHQLGSRKYYNRYGDLVATNRHKAEGQTEPSLEEFREYYPQAPLTVIPARRIYTKHREGQWSPFKPGDTVTYKKGNNTKTFIVETVRQSDNILEGSGKAVKMKFCIKRSNPYGCISYI